MVDLYYRNEVSAPVADAYKRWLANWDRNVMNDLRAIGHELRLLADEMKQGEPNA